MSLINLNFLSLQVIKVHLAGTKNVVASRRPGPRVQEARNEGCLSERSNTAPQFVQCTPGPHLKPLLAHLAVRHCC